MWVKTQSASLVNLEHVAVVQLDTTKTPEGRNVGRVVALNERREVISSMWTGSAEECAEILEQLIELGFGGQRILELKVRAR